MLEKGVVSWSASWSEFKVNQQQPKECGGQARICSCSWRGTLEPDPTDWALERNVQVLAAGLMLNYSHKGPSKSLDRHCRHLHVVQG
jgi:hypothetical protein